MIYNKNKKYNTSANKRAEIPIETVNNHVFGSQQQENETYDIFESLSLTEKYKSLFDTPVSEPVVEPVVEVVEEPPQTENKSVIKETETKTVVKEDTTKKSEKNTISALRDDFDKKLTQVRRLVYSYGGGGGSGTVAVQYANGGTMAGNLEVVGDVTANSVQIANVEFTGDINTNVNSVTALGEFLLLKVNGVDRYVRLFSVE